MNNLPAGWSSPAVTKIARFVRGVTYTKSDAKDAGAPGLIGVVRANNIGDFRFDLSDLVYVPERFVNGEQKLQVGDVVIATSSGSINVVGKAAPVLAPMHLSFGAFCGVLRPVIEIEPRYFGRYFQSDAYRSAASAAARGMNINNLKRSHFDTFHIAFPGRATQKRIADKLDALLSRVEACRVRLNRVPRLLKTFREAVLEGAVSGRLTEAWRASAHVNVTGLQLARDIRARHESSKKRGSATAKYDEVERIREVPPSWGWIPGAAIVDPGADIVYGIVQPGPKLSEGIPYVRGMDIENGKILTQQLLKTSEAIAKRYERASLRGGDVLLGIIRATKVAIVPNELAGANITQGTARFRPSSAIRTSYLARVLEAPGTQKWLHDCYRGIDMPGLNLADVRRVPIPLPSLEEQDEITRRVDALFALGDNLIHLHETATTKVERLTPSILAKAFRGDLVPQDPNDEPANELLNRICTNPAAKHGARERTGLTRLSHISKASRR